MGRPMPEQTELTEREKRERCARCPVTAIDAALAAHLAEVAGHLLLEVRSTPDGRVLGTAREKTTFIVPR